MAKGGRLMSESSDVLSQDWSVHPGAFLRDVLANKRIPQSELAARAGLTAKHINQIVTESIGISGDVALALERVLGVPVDFWINSNAHYEAFLSQRRAAHRLPDYTDWALGFHQPTLERNGIVRPTDHPTKKAERLLKFFEVANPDAFARTWLQPRVAFRRSQHFTVDHQNTALWLRLVERTAERAAVADFRPAALRRLTPTIARLTSFSLAEGFSAARTALAETGVALSFVREIPGTRVLGATLWLPGDRPAIGVTERQKKPDVLWFNVLHEIGHLLLHPRRTTFLDLERDKGTPDAAEEEANRFAENELVPEHEVAQIEAAKSKDQLLLIAARLGVGSSVVAGRHGRVTQRWDFASSLRGRISEDDVAQLEGLTQ